MDFFLEEHQAKKALNLLKSEEVVKFDENLFEIIFSLFILLLKVEICKHTDVCCKHQKKRKTLKLSLSDRLSKFK